MMSAFWPALLAAQIGDNPRVTSRYGYDFQNSFPNFPDGRAKAPDSRASASASGDESCFMPPLTGMRSPTAGVASLEVPAQPRKYFQSACSAVSHNKLAKAEEQLRKALDEDTKYTAAWVLLGQVLKAQQKPDDARKACSQALRVDSGYVAAVLCLADISAVEQRWQEVLSFANSAVALDPANNPQAHFYAAGAYLGLHRLAEAEESALRAVEIDKANREPRTHFLLAQIYEMQRKPDAEAVQLEEYLKSANDPQEVAMVKKYLADLTGNHK
jgi:tetratricopeptide (TPR) repeat protein